MASTRVAAVLTLIALVSAQEGKKCADPSTKVDMRKGVMKHTGDMRKALYVAIKGDEQAQKLIEDHDACQWSCFAEMMMVNTLPTFFSAGFANTGDKKVLELGTEAVTGGIKACYPGVPRSEALSFAEGVVKLMLQISQGKIKVDDATKAPFDTSKMKKCPGHPEGGAEAQKDFLKFVKSLPAAFEEKIKDKKFKDLSDFLDSESYDCQMKCAFADQGSISMALQIFWATGKVGESNRKELGVDAITGALKTCYPRVPHDTVKSFVSDAVTKVLKEMGHLSRLYPTMNIPFLEDQEETGSSSLTMVAGGVAVLSVGMMVTTLALRRRRSTPSGEEARELEAVEGLE
jgi:hypothetical protein